MLDKRKLIIKEGCSKMHMKFKSEFLICTHAFVCFIVDGQANMKCSYLTIINQLIFSRCWGRNAYCLVEYRFHFSLRNGEVFVF